MLIIIFLASSVPLVSAGLTYNGSKCGNTSDFSLWDYDNVSRYQFDKNVKVSVNSLLLMTTEYAGYYLKENKTGKLPTLQFNISDHRYKLFDWKTKRSRDLDEEIVYMYFVYWDNEYTAPRRVIGVQLECHVSPDFHSCRKRLLERCAVLNQEEQYIESIACLKEMVGILLLSFAFTVPFILLAAFCVISCDEFERRRRNSSNIPLTSLFPTTPVATASQAISSSLEGNRSKKVRALPPIKTKTVEETVPPRPSSPLMSVD